MRIDIDSTFCVLERCEYIPRTMKRLNNWCVWRLEQPEKGKKKTKVPYSAITTKRASSTNPRTWADYSQAKKVFELFYAKKIVNGMGFFFKPEDGLVFIDIDHCIVDGQLSGFAKSVVTLFSDSYWEVSQSGEGLHCFTRGNIERNFKRSDIGLEVYNNKRYVAFTGDSINPTEPTDGQPGLDILFEKYGTIETSEGVKKVCHAISDNARDIILKASASPSNGDRFTKLFNGQWQEIRKIDASTGELVRAYPTQSEADQALCNILAFWCNRNRDLIDEVFCLSELYRYKWKGPYRESTLDKAINICKMDKQEYMEQRDIEQGIVVTEEDREYFRRKRERKQLSSCEVE